MKRSGYFTGFVVACLVATACSRSGSSAPATTSAAAAPAGTSAAAAATTTTATDQCHSAPLQATDVGVTASTITIEVMADTGSPLAPGLFQGNVDAVKAFAAFVNKTGGVGCRQLLVKSWDSHLDPSESKNGLIDACQNAVSMVGNNALFNPDVSTLATCADKTGAATGLPDIPALANDINEQCAPQAFIIQAISETCPITKGQPRPEKAMIGPTKWFLQQTPGLHGLFMVPGDLPTTVQSATYQIDAQAQAGIVWDGTPKVSGSDAQPSYTPRVQLAKTKGSNFVYDGSNDTAMIRMRKEATAQGLTSVKTWACSLACYTKAMITQGGADAEGTYVWMQFLPFEEAASNPEDQNYVTSVTTPDSFGAQAWQAAVAFQTAVNQIVTKSGPNAITRATLFTALKGLTGFTANGWMGAKDLQGPGAFSDCFLIMQVQNGKFVRVYPTASGQMDCNASNLVTLTVDPAAEAAKLK